MAPSAENSRIAPPPSPGAAARKKPKKGKKSDATKVKKIKSKVDAKALKPLKPKKKCCETRPRCTRCPLRLLAEGRMPEGWTVKHRRLVKADKPGTSKSGKSGKAKRGKAG